MKLLLVTQKLDTQDPVLGFFHHWVTAFAHTVESVTVICLQKGKCALPENVTVLSLGKEGGISRLKYISRFYKYIWGQRNNYDSVLVHMNHIYVVLGWCIWKMLGKKIALWYNHKKGSPLVRLAGVFSNVVFHTSSFAFTARMKNAVQSPVGVDTEIFKNDPAITREENSVVMLGRISPVKNVHVFIDAVKRLLNEGTAFVARIYGDAPERDKRYADKLQSETEKTKEIIWEGSLQYNKTVEAYNRAGIFVNLTDSGSFDKTIIEAMACETPVLLCNDSLAGIVPDFLFFEENNAKELAERIEHILLLSSGERAALGEQLRQYVLDTHSLSALVTHVLRTIQK